MTDRKLLRSLLPCLGVAALALVACASEIKAPTAVANGPDGEVAVGVTVQLDGSMSTDPGGRALVYAWRFAETPAGSVVDLSAADTAKAHFTPDAQGSYVVELVVSNGARTSAPANVTVTVGECGTHAPAIASLTATPEAPDPGEPVGLSAEVTDADVDAPCGLTRTLSYHWSLTRVPPGSAAQIAPADALEPSFTPDLAGTYEAALVVTDELGRASAAGTLVVEASACGTAVPEIAELTARPENLAIGQTTVLGATVVDADTDSPCELTESFAYTWSVAEAPAGSQATLTLPASRTPSLTADVEGDYVVELVVIDAAGLESAVGSITLVASQCGGNSPSIASLVPGNSQPAVGETVQLTAEIEDADTSDPCTHEETFSYRWSLLSLPGGSAAALNATGVENPSFAPDVPGDYVVGLVVTDSTGNTSALETVTIVASTCGDNAPVALVSELVPANDGPSTDLLAADVPLGSTVQISGAASTDADVGGVCGLTQSLDYHWRFLALPAGSNASLNDTGIENPSFQADEWGTFVVGLTVTDSTGRVSVEATFTVDADPAADVNVPGGFSIDTLAFRGLIDGPQGLTEDGAGNIYVAQVGSDSVVRIDGAGDVTIFSAAGFLNGPADIAFDAGSSAFFVSSGTRIVKLDTLGVQSSCLGPGGGANYRGVEIYNGTGGLRLAAVDDNLNRVAFINPMACTITTTNDFGGNLDGPWGVAAATVSAADHVYVSDDAAQEIWRNSGGAYVTDGGAEIMISSDGRIDQPRDIVATPCGTPRLLVADRGRGEIFLFDDSASAPLEIFASGLDEPVGLFFEDADTLLVTDENRDAVYRVAGDFCAL